MDKVRFRLVGPRRAMRAAEANGVAVERAPASLSSARSRRVARFTKSDVVRAIEGAESAASGRKVVQLRIGPDGSIDVFLGTPQPAPSTTPNPWDGTAL